MAFSIAAEWRLGRGGDAVAGGLGLVSGWSNEEAEFVWMVGDRSIALLPCPVSSGPLCLEIEAFPLLHAPLLTRQRLGVSVEGVWIGEAILTEEGRTGFLIPPSLHRNNSLLDVSFWHRNATSPAQLGLHGDTRELAVAVRGMRLIDMGAMREMPRKVRAPLPTSLPGGLLEAVQGCAMMPPETLVCAFESLGHDCGFGMLQRGLGAEPLGLLRFAGIERPDLLRGLESGFAGIGEGEIAVSLGRCAGRMEYLARETRYGANFHTGLFVDEAEENAVRPRMMRYLGLLRRQFVEVAESAARIFVLHQPSLRGQADALPVLSRLRGFGDNALLYVTEGGVVPPGTVAREADGLFHGFIDRHLTMDRADQMNGDAWVSVCANAYRLWREDV